jgi:CheY-like chemotaxis protein/nitrogen-specific signal transduction histidine kinase
VTGRKDRFARDEVEFLEIISAYAAIAMDRAASDKAILQAKRLAEEANRSKDAFLAALSHELRTPLTPVLMTASSLEHDHGLDLHVRKQLGVVRHNVELEARLIDDLLDVTKITRGKFSVRPEKVGINNLIHHALEIVEPDAAQKELKVEVRLGAEQDTGYADPARLEQVFWNLLKNAIKFTPHGGIILVQTYNPKPQCVTFEVTDSGIGIAPEDLHKIFRPFEQGAVSGSHQFGGLGLGLAIARAIVDLHDGEISAFSEGVNQGATFRVSLPLEEVGFESSTHTVPKNKAVKPMHILLVEDNEQTRSILSRLLTRDGHEVESAANCAAAIEAIHSHENVNPFQVIISDLGLPDGNGLNLVRQIKAEAPQVTAIALSGYGTDEDIRKSMHAGFTKHLTKPINIEELRSALAA